MLSQPELAYSAFVTSIKTNDRMKLKWKENHNSRYINNKFSYDLPQVEKAYVNKSFTDQIFKIDNGRSTGGFQRGLGSTVYSFLQQKDKISKIWQSFFKKLIPELLDTFWGDKLPDMQLLKNI